MLERTVTQSTSASMHEKYWIFFSKQQFHQNKTSYVQKALLLGFKNEY